MKNNLTYIGLIVLLVVVIVFGALYSIDLKYMDEGKPVAFSTWGREYTPVESDDADRIQIAINKYIVSREEKNSHIYNENWFSAEKIFLITKQEDVYYAYAWVHTASYVKKAGGELLEGSGFSIPYKFTLVENDDELIVNKAESPRDGDQYVEDMESLFPEKVLARMSKVHNDETIEELQLLIQQQVAEFYN